MDSDRTDPTKENDSQIQRSKSDFQTNDCPHCEDGERHPDDGACLNCQRRFADTADGRGRL